MATTLAGKPLAILESDDSSLPDDLAHNAVSKLVDGYEYDKLPDSHCFRLLTLLPGDGDTKLECEIETHNLDEDEVPTYRAVSYTWMESKYDNLVISGRRVTEFPGSRARYSIRHPLWCGNRQLLVSTNLRDALRRFRHPTQPLRLWIDAACINQEDLEERANQVILMPKVYHSAVSVWFWLGESDDASRVALAWLSSTHESYSRARDAQSSPATTFEMNIGPGEAEALVSLLQRPVFQRIWIVQELVTANEVVVFCGEDSLPYSTIQFIVATLTDQSLDLLLSDDFSGGNNYFHFTAVILPLMQEWLANRRNPRKALVLATRNFRATDPRDKVFALLGLFNDYAHRDACHLGLCDASHRTLESISRESDAVDVVRHRETDWGKGCLALTNAFRELLSHHAEVQRMGHEKEHALTLRMSPDGRLHVVREHLDAYLESLLCRVLLDIRELRYEGTTDVTDTAGLSSNAKHVEALTSFLDSNPRTPQTQEQKVAASFVSHVMQTSGAATWETIELKAHSDAKTKYQKSLNKSEKTLNYFLRLLRGDDSRDASAADSTALMPSRLEDPEAAQFCEFHSSHDGPLEYDPGQLTMGHVRGLYYLACSSCDIGLIGPALEALGRSTHPPHEGCTLSEQSWRLLKAVFGDMSGWIRQGEDSQVFARDLSARGGGERTGAPSLEELVDTTWLTLPVSSYLEQAQNAMDNGRERLQAQPLQQWSWNPSIPRMPDYRLPVKEVYREFTLRCLHDDPDLFILSLAGPDSSAPRNDLPSWVPDFSGPRSRSPLAFPDVHVTVGYQASGDTKPVVSWSPENPDTVTLRGHIADSILTLTRNGKATDLQDAVLPSLALVRNTPSVYESTDARMDALWRTLTANVGSRPAYEHPAPAAMSRLFEEYTASVPDIDPSTMADYPVTREDQNRRGLSDKHENDGDASGSDPGDATHATPSLESQNHEHNGSPELTDPTGPQHVHPDDLLEESFSGAGPPTSRNGWESDRISPGDFRDAATRAMAERNFFITSSGHFGLSPIGAEESDLVCLLAGGRVPYILRPCNDKAPGTFMFLGECYCHGLSEGKILAETGVTWEDIRIG